jgi:AraC-like DNA-binding protein/ActR/RegA family two-component response regulator
MGAHSILWMDLRTTLTEPDLCSSLPRAYGAERVRKVAELLHVVQNRRPWAVCFEYDVPDARGLAALAEVKQQYPALPILMLTERHAKTLVNWAFRRCVWDYMVKPVSVRHLCNCLTNIDKAVPPAERLARQLPAASSSIHVLGGKPLGGGTLAPAVSYVASNYQEKLRMATAARLCELSPFQFSRSFKKENGLTFRDFVIRVRIERAAELMKHSAASVTEAAFDVGFNDLSYFARMFRRQLGVTPSHYRTENEPRQLPLFPPDEWPPR